SHRLALLVTRPRCIQRLFTDGVKRSNQWLVTLPPIYRVLSLGSETGNHELQKDAQLPVRVAVPKSQWNDASQLEPVTDGRYGSDSAVAAASQGLAGTSAYPPKPDAVAGAARISGLCQLEKLMVGAAG